MGLATSGALLSAAMVASGMSTSGVADATAMANAMGSWFISNTVATPAPTLLCAGGVVSGFASLVVASGSSNYTALGDAMAHAINPTADASALAMWTKIAAALINHCNSHWHFGAASGPMGWTYPTPGGGPVAGSPASTFFDQEAMSPILSSQLGFADSANQTVWAALSNNFVDHLATAQVPILGFAGADGSPVTGAGTIS